jgi:hypothetical protein
MGGRFPPPGRFSKDTMTFCVRRVRGQQWLDEEHKTYIPSPHQSHYSDSMRSEDLTREQAQAIKDKITPMLSYLNRLAKRMNQRRFPPDDRLMQAVGRAAQVMHELNVKVHYLSCGTVNDGKYPRDVHRPR